MSSTASTLLRQELMAQTENAGAWGNKINTNLGILELGITGVFAISTTGGTTTLANVDYTADDAKNATLDVTGALVSNAIVVVPNLKRTYRVFNRTTGSYTLSVKTSSGSAIVVTQATVVTVACDGSNVCRFVTPLTDYTTGAPATASGAAASSVSVSPTGNLGSVTVQAGLVELQGDIDTLNAAIIAGVQPLDADLTAIAGLSNSKGNMIVGGASAWVAQSVGSNYAPLVADSAQSTGIGWLSTWTMKDDDSGYPLLRSTSTTAAKTGYLVCRGGATAGAASDFIGGYYGEGRCSNGSSLVGGFGIEGYTVDPVAATYSSYINVGWTTNAVDVNVRGSGAALSPATNDTIALGTSSLGWSDLFLASGSVLNIGASNWVATHTSAVLTVGTGDLRVSSAGTNSASVVTVGGSQTLTGKTITSPTISSPTITTSPTASGATWTSLGTVTTADINGGTLDGVTIGGSSPAAASFTSVSTTGNLGVGGTSLTLSGAGSCGFEIGRTDGNSSTPFVDFHSGATAVDYDARIVASGGSGSSGGGDLQITAANVTLGTSGRFITGTVEVGHATDTTLSRASGGQLAVEGVNVLMNGGALGTPSSATLTNATGLPITGITASTSTSFGCGSVELGHASDTTISRASAGVIAVEGVQVALNSTTFGHTCSAIEVGQVGSTNTPYIDFHSSSSSTDYDVRLIASGGTGSAGAGDLTVYAGSMTLGTSMPLTLGTIQLGHASDTTVARAAAGVMSVEGARVIMDGSNTVTSGAILYRGSQTSMIDTSTDGGALSIKSTTGSPAKIYFDANATVGAYFGLDTDGAWRVGGRTYGALKYLVGTTYQVYGAALTSGTGFTVTDIPAHTNLGVFLYKLSNTNNNVSALINLSSDNGSNWANTTAMAMGTNSSTYSSSFMLFGSGLAVAKGMLITLDTGGTTCDCRTDITSAVNAIRVTCTAGAYDGSTGYVDIWTW